jgi:GNAT superfamily N-acetyltransferase
VTAAPISLRSELRPGDIGHVVRRHGEIYAREYGWSPEFEAYVARTLGAFGERHDAERERLWLAEVDGRIAGSVGIVSGEADAAQLRWFLVEPESRGLGIGRRLLETALDFCRSTGRQRVYLWTVAGLDAAVRLYRATGFRLAETVPGHRFGTPLVEERYDLELQHGTDRARP